MRGVRFHVTIFKHLILIAALLAFSVSYGAPIYIDKNNALHIVEQNSWRLNDFKNIGFQISISYEVEISEGVFSTSKDNFNVLIAKDDEPVLVLEVIEGKLWRGNLLSSSIPIQVKSSDGVLYLGLTISSAMKNYGGYQAGSGHEIGSYLTFENLNDASFHTQCSFFHLEQTLEEQEMSEDQFNDYCTIDRMLFFGNKDMVISDEI